MMDAFADCPLCGQEDALSFYEGTENGAPHGAGFWPMQVSDSNQHCDCEIPEKLWDLVKEYTWNKLELQEQQSILQNLEQALVNAYRRPEEEQLERFRSLARSFSPQLEYEYYKDLEPSF